MDGEIKYMDKPWLKSYEKGVPATINYKELCMPDFHGQRRRRPFPIRQP